MADPLSIAASIAGLVALGVRIGVTLNEFITSVKTGPASVHAISRELGTLNLVLTYIQTVITDDSGSSKDVGAGLLSFALRECMKSFQELDSRLEALRTEFRSNTMRRAWGKISWYAGEREIEVLASSLGNYKGTLGLALQLERIGVLERRVELLEGAKAVIGGSELVGGSVSGSAVLISAATLEEVQGHSGFNSWLSEFVSTPALEAKGTNDFFENLVKLTTGKSKTEEVLAVEANDRGVKDLVQPAWTKDNEKHVEEVVISPGSTIFDLCEMISSKGYDDICGFKIYGEEEDFVITPFTSKSTAVVVTVTSGPSCYDLRKGYQINCDETLIKFFNHRYGPKADERFDLVNHGTYLSIGDTLRRTTIQFKRILRIPDDGNTYNLPKDVGSFNLFEASAFEKMPSSLQAKGGFFFPIYQREALCLGFSYVELGSVRKRNDSQFAIKVYAGGVNAVSGGAAEGERESEQEYIVVPLQKWLGGFSTGSGEAKQFVPMPLGSGYTVEHQLTGKENIGGIQLEIIPRYLDDCLFGKVQGGDKNVKVDTEILEKASVDHFLTPKQLGLRPGDRIYMQDLGETPYNYDFKFPHKEVDSLEHRTVVPKYKMEEERPTFVHELFVRDRTRCYDPCSSLTITPITAFSLTIVPRAEWEWMPFDLKCSPFTRIRDLPRTVQQILPSGWIIQEFEFPNGKIESYMATTLYQMGISEPTDVYVKGTHGLDLPRTSGNAGGQSRGGEGSWDIRLAAGGKIKQTIAKDPDPRVWNKAAMKMFNIQMVNFIAFEAVTGLVPPMPTVSFEDYAKAEIPYYVHNQANPSWIRQQFDSTSTVSEIDSAKGVEFLESLKPLGGTLVGCVCCERNICDCILDMCKHTFCHSCVEYYMVTNKKVTCGLCDTPATRIIRFSSSMPLRLLDNQQPHQMIGKPTTMSLDSAPLPTTPAKSLTPETQAELRNFLVRAVQKDNVGAVMLLLRAGADAADNTVFEHSIFWCSGIQCENNVIFDLMLAQVLADVQKMEKVNWQELMSIAVRKRNEYCIKRLAPLCAVEVEVQVENHRVDTGVAWDAERRR